MKYSILLCLLISLSNLKQYDYPDYPDDIKTLIEDQERCYEAGTQKDKCYSVSLKTPNAQCCILEYISYTSHDTYCSIIEGSIEDVKNNLYTPKIKAILKEYFGFQVYGLGEIVGKDEEEMINEIRNKQNYQCKDGDFDIPYGYETYTSQDKSILKSNQQCLRYFHSYVIDYDYMDKMPSKEQCFNADLLESSKNIGIKCGFYEFTIRYVSGNSGNFKSCYVFDTDIIKNRKIDNQSKTYLSALAYQYASLQNEMFASYIVDFSDSDGNSFRYDSLTNTVTSLSKGENNKISKYLLFLFILILF